MNKSMGLSKYQTWRSLKSQLLVTGFYKFGFEIPFGQTGVDKKMPDTLKPRLIDERPSVAHKQHSFPVPTCGSVSN
jgi:hypothetical protein